MEIILFVYLFVCIIHFSRSVSHSEVCQWESFRPQCPKNDHVIQITKAYFGRMRSGRCLQPSVNYVNDMIGCNSDVTRIADARCSGRTSCVIAIPDKELDNLTSCRADLKSYLMISYKCIQGWLGWVGLGRGHARIQGRVKVEKGQMIVRLRVENFTC
ncbi:hypothetical protein HELRODRAFT_168432 [Helobdella robusta]|uniref:SUEL-type lectin domain-containing protein n=1 Tax=Helobdella robusta TaxID=6412 RepID=T1F0L2_HELRO|nr:hypothetical protein HELRODRAFT_168432 [Helobdella robusta]ESO09448.1 hypothetical protein HELRODRAFT_168432 [Helobdella robusta]